jgi:hypothetical protein
VTIDNEERLPQGVAAQSLTCLGWQKVSPDLDIDDEQIRRTIGQGSSPTIHQRMGTCGTFVWLNGRLSGLLVERMAYLNMAIQHANAGSFRRTPRSPGTPFGNRVRARLIPPGVASLESTGARIRPADPVYETNETINAMIAITTTTATITPTTLTLLTGASPLTTPLCPLTTQR